VFVIIKEINMTAKEMVFSYIIFLGFLVTLFFKFIRTFNNFFSVFILSLRGKYPIEAMLKNGTHIVLNNRAEMLTIILAQGYNCIEIDPINDVVNISLHHKVYNKSLITLCGLKLNINGYIEVFLEKEYDYLPVKDKIVIDIGANIADSSIYFALCGASKVIALEPFPKNYEMAKKNIALNNLSDKITLILAGCSGDLGFINSYQSPLPGNKDLIPLLRLEDILKENGIDHDDSVLKMDCEGYEYDILMSSKRESLRRFRHMQIEYHYGYKNLKEKLETCGFNVSVTRPRAFLLLSSQNTMLTRYQQRNWQHLGYLYAERNG
jgi:FkbM family methyltransferase